MKLIEMTLAGFVDTAASDAPAPGGGSVSALEGALGAALTSMVCALTLGKKNTPMYRIWRPLPKNRRSR